MATRVTRPTAFELKGRMTTLTVLRLLEADPDAVLVQLDGQLRQAPAMFEGMPLAIDTAALTEPPAEGTLATLVQGLRERGLAPVALVGEVDRAAAARAGLGVIADRGGTVAAPTEGGGAASAEAPAEAPERPAASRVVSQPVRSGQQIYARGGDLVVLASVSPGAEVLADGHIHIYGALNGRALAGVQGDIGARIFCRRLNAELIAIAGRYQVSDNISDDDLGGEVLISLRDDALTIEPLPTVG